jgi:hypothetical protein
MSLNNIQLNFSIIGELYKNLLIETNEVLQQLEATPSSPLPVSPEIKAAHGKKENVFDIHKEDWRYLGENKKNILLIVYYKNVTHLPDDHLNFLTSVLTACKLNLGDIAILNTANHPLAIYKTVQEKFKSGFIILFGLTPGEFEMPLNFPEFQIQAFNNCTFLHTPAIEKLEVDKVLKSKLWVSLRKMFNLS